VRLDQVGSATSGTAQVFDNSFLGEAIAGTWSGTFDVDGIADFVVTSVTFTASSSSAVSYIFTLTKGLAIFVGG